MKEFDDTLHPETIDQVIENTGSPQPDIQTARLLHHLRMMARPDVRANDQSLDHIWNRLHYSHEHAISLQATWRKATGNTAPEKEYTEKESTTMQENNIPWGINSSSSHIPKRSSPRRAIGIAMMTAASIILIAGFTLLSGILRHASQTTASTIVGSAGQVQISSANAGSQCHITSDPTTLNSASWPPSLSWSTQGQIAFGTQTAFKIVSARNCSTVFSKSVQNASNTTWSPDGKKVAITADNSLYIFDNHGNTITHLSFAQLNALQVSEEHGIGILGWSSDDHQLFFSSADANYRGLIRSLDLSQGNKTTDLITLPANSVLDQLSPDRQFALVVSRNPVNQDKALELWNITRGQKIEVFPSNHNGSGPDVLALSSDSTLLARDDGDTQVKIYRLSDGKFVRSFPFPIGSLAFEHATWSPDDKYIAAGKSGVTIYDVSTGKAVTTVGQTDASHQILSIAWSPNSEGLATMRGPADLNDPSAATFNVWNLH